MKEFSITEVRRRFSELVERASKRERIGITKYGVLVAVLQPATEVDRRRFFKNKSETAILENRPPLTVRAPARRERRPGWIALSCSELLRRGTVDRV